MIYLRRRQKYASNAIQTRNAASVGANGAKVGRGPPPGGFGKQGTHAGSGDYPSSTKNNLFVNPLMLDGNWPDSQNEYECIFDPEHQTNRMLYEIRSSLVDDGEESPRLGLLAANSQSASSPPPPTSTMSEGDAIEYAELTFPADQTPGRRAPFHASATLGRRSSGCRPTRKPTPGPSTSGAGSASMQQLPRSHTQDNDDAEGNYTEIVGVMQPKAYTSQLVLKQQQEATKAILGMNSNAQSVFV
uniref:Focal_AT domain-containing protein n=2 Tax=Mesocestoides corti TaxID=53468 RepID=A0A5K3FUZ8_MESCO